MYIDVNTTSSKYICPEKYLELSILHIQKNTIDMNVYFFENV